MSKIKVDVLETLDGSKSFNVADLSAAAHPVEDVLTSTNPESSLSANQGRVLKGLVDNKQDALVSATNIKSINGQSLVGAGDLAVAGVTDHGALTGLGDDDHVQYYDQTRGDARYSQLGHGHAIADVTGLQSALDGKQATLVSATNIKTINGTSLLGSGDLTVGGGGGGSGDVVGPASSTASNFALFDGTTGKLLKDTGVKAADFAAASHTHAIADVTGLQTALDGKVVGPASATNNAVVLFDGTTGKLVKDSAKTLPSGDVIGTTDAQTLTNKTLDLSANTVTVDGTNPVGFRNVPQNSQSTAYTAVLSDAGKHILHPSADTTARTFTIPANASVAYPIGTAITIVNQNGAGTVTIAITSDTMRLAGAGTTGSRTLAANGIATALKITSTEWIISGTGLT